MLLHLERGIVLVAGLALVALIGTRATMGHFPFRLGQIAGIADMQELMEIMRAQQTRRPEPPPSPRNLEEYRVWRQTRLPEIKKRLAEIDMNLRWLAEGRYKIPGERIPFP